MIKYIIQAKKNPQKKDEKKKFYPQIAPSTPVTLPQIVKRIEKRSTVSSADVKAVLDALQTEVIDALESGNTVRLGDLGSFRLTIKSEGVATAARDVVKGGRLKGYFLSSYSARKLGMQTTGNAGGSHNLRLSSRLTARGDNFARMLKKMGTGLLVTEVMGQGVNYVTGDYSRGASGFWVENGEIQYPVEEITIAGNLADMYRGIVAVGNDELTRGTKTCGSVLIEEMAVAG